MKIKLDYQTIKQIDVIQKFSGTDIIDCINTSSTIYFVVAQGQYGKIVGKKGAKIKAAEKLFKKKIKIFEYDSNIKSFIKNIIPSAKDIIIKDKKIFVHVHKKDRAKAIGSHGENVKTIKTFMQRIFGMEDLKVL
ncbi:MAG: NusA-like transcription termination signal-binding factor [Candidatus Aenigmarchaeota archaeon]|nr:NusA-like transcription termination signal-binding factor [Candidatus Aenigmarchaeota archaeon]